MKRRREEEKEKAGRKSSLKEEKAAGVRSRSPAKPKAASEGHGPRLGPIGESADHLVPFGFGVYRRSLSYRCSKACVAGASLLLVSH